MKPRTRLALVQNCFIGIPVIIAISVFNGIFASSSALVHTLGSAVVGFCVSFLMLYISLSTFKIKSRYDDKQPNVLSASALQSISEIPRDKEL